MNSLFKFLFFIIVGGLALYGGVFLFRYFNQKIKSAATGWSLLAYIICMIIACAALLVGCIYALIYGYAWLASPVN